MAVDKENKRFFVTDSLGTLYIYSTEVTNFSRININFWG